MLENDPGIKLIRSFESKYGKGSFEKFKNNLIRFRNLAEVAREFKITRSYASVLFKKLYGKNFKEVCDKRPIIRRIV